MTFCVDIWDTIIRRRMNDGLKLDYDFSKIGDARLLLQDAKAIYSMYIGTASSEYCIATTTLTLFFVVYDKEYEAVVEARMAKVAIQAFIAWYKYSGTSTYNRVLN